MWIIFTHSTLLRAVIIVCLRLTLLAELTALANWILTDKLKQVLEEHHNQMKSTRLNSYFTSLNNTNQKISIVNLCCFRA